MRRILSLPKKILLYPMRSHRYNRIRTLSSFLNPGRQRCHSSGKAHASFKSGNWLVASRRALKVRLFAVSRNCGRRSACLYIVERALMQIFLSLNIVGILQALYIGWSCPRSAFLGWLSAGLAPYGQLRHQLGSLEIWGILGNIMSRHGNGVVGNYIR
ncbi:hypothetical protein F4776DRAFT_104537 [Hypoxylon sp. NC0597]|nr:hypothetical protein F4776DRAFT_104537 [Hypoxylon sp. NC0597]